MGFTTVRGLLYCLEMHCRNGAGARAHFSQRDYGRGGGFGVA